jgi:hypothetical protein
MVCDFSFLENVGMHKVTQCSINMIYSDAFIDKSVETWWKTTRESCSTRFRWKRFYRQARQFPFEICKNRVINWDHRPRFYNAVRPFSILYRWCIFADDGLRQRQCCGFSHVRILFSIDFLQQNQHPTGLTQVVPWSTDLGRRRQLTSDCRRCWLYLVFAHV